MHDSHKLWITIAVFLVVIGLLLGMYFTATPDKVGSVIKNRRAEKSNSASNKNGQSKDVYNAAAQQAIEHNVPDELKSLDLDSIKAEHGEEIQEGGK